VSITATQADHDGARYRYFGDELAVGYLIDGLSTIYFAGDTDIYPEMVDMAGKVDVALLPVWLISRWVCSGSCVMFLSNHPSRLNVKPQNWHRM
jgi:hypothetical protein